MGLTGTGKSSLIKTLTGDKAVTVGDNLESGILPLLHDHILFTEGLCVSETQDVTGHHCKYRGQNYSLIDTPGFDDTDRTPDEVCTAILNWLASSYRAGQRLHGIIYLHRIQDVRISGSARTNLQMFQKLCGEKALKNVILVTTFWDKVGLAEGERREAELISSDKFWGRMIKKESKVRRCSPHKPESAFAILNEFSTSFQCVLKAQEEIVKDGKDPSQTEAASFTRAAMKAEMEAKLKVESELAEKQKREAEERAMQQKKILEQQRRDHRQRIEREKREIEAELQRAEARRRLERAELVESRRRLAEESARQLQLIEEETRALEARQREEARRARVNYYRGYSCIHYRSPAGPYTRCSNCRVFLRWRTEYYRK
jgi:GTP-binding protein EngB required for normal cell division